MKLPAVNTLILQAIDFLKGFDPRTVVFLDRRGQWTRNPQTIRDRVSNELWFFIWQSHQKDDRPKLLRDILTRFVSDQTSWMVTRKIYRWLCSSECPNPDDVLQVVEVLAAFILHQVWHRNGTAYVPDWDSRGKARRARNMQRARAFSEGMEGCLGGESEVARFWEMWQQLMDVEGAPIDRLCGIISEEERIRDEIETVLRTLWEARQKDEVLALLEEQVGPKLTMKPANKEALLRPCLDLLTLAQLDMTSGLQFEVTGILGKLHDVRSTEHLITVLENCPRRYTQVRCNVIFALGHLREKAAVPYFLEVLTGPNSIEVSLSDQSSRYTLSLHGEKRECIWALGRLGAEALEAISVLTRYARNPEGDISAALAWALGCIGKEQKEKYGGLDAALVASLLQLLQAEDSLVFEESVMAMKQLGLPDFLHNLYLHNFATVPILSLKPSSTGLYELSETLYHLMSIKSPVVMAVTGDSGTGKTYFCEAITEGFGAVRSEDILYLQRDRRSHMMIFNRILGLRWLRDHVDPQHYENYPLTEEEDDPALFFRQFMQQHARKKLIILDGWRDREYFHRVVQRFYDEGHLDVLVKFHTTYATKRLNLEEREGTLERVTAHLPLVESPDLEKTGFYCEGAVLLYQLDHSTPSRLDQSEIREVFRRKKVSAWGDTIYIGNLAHRTEKILPHKSVWKSRQAEISSEKKKPKLEESISFIPRETAFQRILNEHPGREQNLLQIIKPGNGTIGRISFYTQGQVAYGGDDGSIGILSGFQDRNFSAAVHEQAVRCLAVSGGAIFSADTLGLLKETSFRQKRIMAWATGPSPVCALASGRDGVVVMGHEDGSVQLWDRNVGERYILHGHTSEVRAVAMGRPGIIFSGDTAGQMHLWDLKMGRLSIFGSSGSQIEDIEMYPDSRLVMAKNVWEKTDDTARNETVAIWIVDPESGQIEIFRPNLSARAKALKVYFDGRIFVGLSALQGVHEGHNLLVIDPRPKQPQISFLPGHGTETADCITMGPRIITCGREKDGQGTLRIWGGESYISSEIKKLKLLPDRMEKPPYYRTIF